MRIQESPSETQVFLFSKNMAGSTLVSGSRKSNWGRGLATEAGYFR